MDIDYSSFHQLFRIYYCKAILDPHLYLDSDCPHHNTSMVVCELVVYIGPVNSVVVISSANRISISHAINDERMPGNSGEDQVY